MVIKGDTRSLDSSSYTIFYFLAPTSANGAQTGLTPTLNVLRVMFQFVSVMLHACVWLWLGGHLVWYKVRVT